MTVFDRIKNLSDNQGKSMQSVAEDIGMSKNIFYRWKTTEPKAVDLQKVADYFNVSVDYLLGRTNSKAIEPVSIEDEMYIAFRKNEERLPEAKREEYRKEMERYMRFIMSEMEKDD